MYKYSATFNEFNIHFSKNSLALTLTELAQMLKNAIRSIVGKPMYPPVLEIPSIKELLVLGNLTSDVHEEDLKKNKT